MGQATKQLWTEYCRRDIAGDQVKAMKEREKIFTVCQRGIAETKHLYCFKTDSNYIQTSVVTKVMKEEIKICGMEAVFEIVLPTSQIIDLFEYPNKVTP